MISNFDSKVINGKFHLNGEFKKELVETFNKELHGTVSFDHGEITHEKLGTLLVKGEYLRIKPRNSREIVAPAEAKLLATKLTEWANSILVFENDPKYFGELVEVVSLFTIYTNPFYEIESEEMLLVFKMFFIIWYMDDVLEYAIEEKNVPQDVIQEGTHQILQIFKGGNKLFVEVNGFPGFKPLFNAFQEIHESFINCNTKSADISWTLHYFRQRYFDAMRWYAVDKLEGCYSEVTFNYFLMFAKFYDEAAMHILLVQGHCLPKYITKSPSLRRLMDIANTYSGLANDLLGLKKDICFNQRDNLVSFKVFRSGIPLDEAVEQVCSLIKSELTDFLLLRDAILQEFSCEPNLVKYIDILEAMMDGANRVYEQSRRHKSVGSVKLHR